MPEVLIDGVLYVPVEEPLPSGYLSPHFRETEFACNHCGAIGCSVPRSLLAALEDLRAHFHNSPVSINSGYRCPTHNANVGGGSHSQHLYCAAVDVVVKNVPASNVHDYLTGKYPGKYGIGSYSTFTHFDVRDSGPTRWHG